MNREVFISHSSKDGVIAGKICEYLEEKGIGCFIAPRDIEPGHIYGEEIVKGIDNCSKFILIASENSFESQHVLREVERAVNKNMPIIVYKIQEVKVPKAFEYFIMVSQWIDASNTSRIPELPNVIREIKPEQKDESNYTKSQNRMDLIRKWRFPVIIAVIILICSYLIYFSIFINDGKNGNDGNDKETTADVGQKDNLDKDNSAESLKAGDSFIMGKYNNEDIEWIVLNIDENGNKYLITKNIISIKAFDSAKSGKWNMIAEGEEYDREKDKTYSDEQLVNAKGDNEWEKSCIRYWLNSSENKVSYADSTPAGAAFYDSRIAYDKEAGFLSGFMEDEKKRIVKNDNDYIFLPSVEEVNKYIVNGNVIFPETKITEAALQADKTGEIKPLTEQYDGNFVWMTRTADESCKYKIIEVLGDEYTQDGSVFYSDYSGYPRGVRPAVIIK